MNNDNTQQNTTNWQKFKADFMHRISEIKTSRWIRFGVVAAIFTAWVAWLQNWWVILFLFLLFDIYITGYIPFTWWKKSKSKVTQTIMSWVDAIVYALILVYFVFTFIGQNYQIPSSSLEKTLLTGDYLLVSKASYGPRVPMTPIHFPLVQNTFPITNSKSYTEWPKWDYRRLAGIENIKAGDIVVFNFPAGDTIAFKQQNPDYYTLKKMIGDELIYRNPQYANHISNLSIEDAEAFRDQLGREQIKQNSEVFGEIMYRPVDRRENYVKRCVGLPGETFKIINGDIFINDKKQPWPKNAQFNYIFQTATPMTEIDWEDLDVSVADRSIIASVELPSAQYLQDNGFKISDNNSRQYIYTVPLTNHGLEKLKQMPALISVIRQPAPIGEYLFPDKMSYNWTRADYGPVMIPKKGETVKLTVDNWPMYERVIRNYEGHTNSFIKDGNVYIDGNIADSYTFGMDYYFMMGDNRDNSLDSRYWGFVPEDHIVGKPLYVLISFDPDKSLFDGKIRWNRILKDANTGF